MLVHRLRTHLLGGIQALLRSIEIERQKDMSASISEALTRAEAKFAPIIEQIEANSTNASPSVAVSQMTGGFVHRLDTDGKTFWVRPMKIKEGRLLDALNGVDTEQNPEAFTDAVLVITSRLLRQLNRDGDPLPVSIEAVEENFSLAECFAIIRVSRGLPFEVGEAEADANPPTEEARTGDGSSSSSLTA